MRDKGDAIVVYKLDRLGRKTKGLKMYESKQFTLREITETTGVSKSCVYHYLRERDAASN